MIGPHCFIAGGSMKHQRILSGENTTQQGVLLMILLVERYCRVSDTWSQGRWDHLYCGNARYLSSRLLFPSHQYIFRTIFGAISLPHKVIIAGGLKQVREYEWEHDYSICTINTTDQSTVGYIYAIFII